MTFLWYSLTLSITSLVMHFPLLWRALFFMTVGLGMSDTAAVAQTAAASLAPVVKVQVSQPSGTVLAAQEGASVDLTCPFVYEPGDVVTITAPPQDKYLVVRIDDHIPEAMVYAPTGQIVFTIPTLKLHEMYDHAAFSAPSHHLMARVATLAEIAAYRNVALNPLDQRGLSDYFPHATASSVTRDDRSFSSATRSTATRATGITASGPMNRGATASIPIPGSSSTLAAT